MINIDKLLELEATAGSEKWSHGLRSIMMHPYERLNDVKKHYIFLDKSPEYPTICEVNVGCEEDADLIVTMRNNFRSLLSELKVAREIVADYRSIYDDHGDLCNLRDPTDLGLYDSDHFKCWCGYEEAQNLLKELGGDK